MLDERVIMMNILIFNVSIHITYKNCSRQLFRDKIRSQTKVIIRRAALSFCFARRKNRRQIYYPDEPKTSDPTTTALRRQIINFLSKDAIQVQ